MNNTTLSLHERRHSQFIEYKDTLNDFISQMQQPLDKILIYRNSNEFSTESLLQNVIAQHQKIKTNDMFGDIRTIKYDPRFSKNSIALSANAHHLHTDGSFCKFPPSCFLLYFEETDPHGGVSTFLPVAEMLAAMPAAFLQAITESNFCITRSRHQTTSIDDVYIGPLLHNNQAGEQIFRWRNDNKVPIAIESAPDLNMAASAINWIQTYLSDTPYIEYKAKTDELICIPNYSFLHGRTKLSNISSSRCVYRVWLQ